MLNILPVSLFKK